MGKRKRAEKANFVVRNAVRKCVVFIVALCVMFVSVNAVPGGRVQVEAKAGGSEMKFYKEILDLCDKAISEKWDMHQMNDSGLNFMYGYYKYGNEIGYTYKDLDGNGVSELLIGGITDQKGEHDFGGVGMFLDMYTVINDKLVWVVSSMERDRYYLGADGYIYNYGSGGVLASGWTKYAYNGAEGKLEFKESVEYNASVDEDNPWFYKTDKNSYPGTPITEQKAQKRIALYDSQCKPINFTSFAKYHSQKKCAHSYKSALTKATLKKDGKIVKKCTKCGLVKSKTVIPAIKTVTCAKRVVYNGKKQNPAVVVKDRKGKKLKAGTDYTLTYEKGCKNVGSYLVTVSLRGKYSGKKKVSFTIVPQKTGIIKIENGKNSIRVRWEKKAKQVDGYRLQCSTNSEFTKKTTKTVELKKNKSSADFSAQSGKKTYYFRICTYKTVRKNGKPKTICSSWSKVKKFTYET